MFSLVRSLEYLEQVNTVLGIILNGLLLYAVMRFSGTYLGAYKQLLTCFASADMFLVIMHVLMRPRTILVGYTHAVVTDTVFDDRRITALFVAFQSIPFTLIGVHFLYRYWSVRRPHLIALFSNKKFVAFLISLTSGSMTSWFLMSVYGTGGEEESAARKSVVEACQHKYGRRIEHAWIVLDHWRDDRFDAALFLTIVLTDVLMFSSLSLATIFAIRTFYHIKNTAKMSAQFIQLQKKLLLALCAQTFVPSVFVYIPCVVTINIPLFRIHVDIFHDISMPLFTCFPVLDASVMILLITDYRKGLMGIIWKKKVNNEATSRFTT
ncbi:hypothetical protein PMAYCL1PPCAC_09080, partial [Pristionchus mayeri]